MDIGSAEDHDAAIARPMLWGKDVHPMGNDSVQSNRDGVKYEHVLRCGDVPQ
jgi:hypothetical protein